MIIAVIILSVLLVASLTYSVLVTQRALKIDRVLTTGASTVEEFLDLLNTSYGIVGNILQMSLASNDNQIIQIHKELKRIHANLLVVAARLTSAWNHEEEKKAPVSDDS